MIGDNHLTVRNPIYITLVQLSKNANNLFIFLLHELVVVSIAITPIPEESPSLESPTGTPSDLSSPTAVVPSESLQSRKPSRKRFIPSRLSLKKKPQDMHISGEYDHLSPSPTATIIPPVNPILHSVTQSLLKDNKKQTLRLLGSIKLQGT